MGNRKHILLLGSLPYAQEKIISLGHKLTLVMTKEELAFGTKAMELADQTWIHQGDDLEELLKKVKAIHIEDPFDGVLSYSDRGLYQAAKLSAYLNLPGLQVDSVVKTQDKHKFRQALDALPEMNVHYQLCHSVAEAARFYNTVKEPIVLKPTSGMGSKGVMIVHALQDLEEAFAYSSEGNQNPVLVEAYVKGTDFSVETFTSNGEHQLIAITDKYNTGPPHFVGTYHVMPSIAPQEQCEQIFRAVKECLDVMGVTFGLAHTEVKLIGQSVKLIEMQLRPGGRFYHLIEQGLGIEIFEMSVKGLFNQAYKPKEGEGAAAIYYLKSQHTGVIEQIEGVEEVKQAPSVCDLNVRAKIGAEVKEWQNSLHRLGHVICVGNTPEIALEQAKRHGRRIHISTSNK